MLDVRNRTTHERIDAIVRDFIKRPLSGDIEHEQPLQELGLTSIDMVNMMLAIEAEFDVTIPGSKLIPANFRSIESIEALMLELKP